MAIEKGEIRVIENYIKAGDIVFDVGASSGLWTEQVLNRYQHKNISIHAFEPLPNNMFKYAQHCVVIFNNCLLSDKEKFYSFFYYKIYPPVSTIYRRSKKVEEINIGCEPEVIAVPGTTLDLYCERNKIDKINFLKIDVEGAELDVLNGCTQKMLYNIDYIQFEYGGCNLDSHYSLQEIYNFLTSRGFKIHKILDDGIKEIVGFTDDLEDYQLSNFLAIKI